MNENPNVMKLVYRTLIASGLMFLISCQNKSSTTDDLKEPNVNEQQAVPYGSNNGKYILISNTQIYYEEYGKGVPLLMLHGGLSSIESFNKVIPELSRHFRVILVNTPGHGRSEQAPSMSYQFMADYFSKFIDKLKLDSLYVIGWSDGGISGLLLAADRADKIKRIIPTGAQFAKSGYSEEVKQWLNKLSPEEVEKLDGWVENYQSKAYKTNNWKDFITDCMKMWNEEIYVSTETAKRIKAKTLIVLGDRDMVTISHGIEMYNSIKGSEFLVVPNTSHFVFDEQPELFNEIAIKFFTKK